MPQEIRHQARHTYSRKVLMGGRMVPMRYHLVHGRFVPIQIVRRHGRTYVTHGGGAFGDLLKSGLKHVAKAGIDYGVSNVIPVLASKGGDYLKNRIGSGVSQSSRSRSSTAILKALSKKW